MLEGVRIEESAAQGSGGGLYAEYGTASLSSVLIRESSTPLAGGGAAFMQSLVEVEDLALVNNQAHTGGGLALVRARMEADSLSVQSNTSSAHAGGGLIEQSVLHMNFSRVSRNSALGDGGGLYLTQGSYVSGQGNTFMANATPDGVPLRRGGAIYAHDSTVHFKESTALSNVAGDGSLAMLDGRSTMVLSGVGNTFTGNAARYGTGEGALISIQEGSTCLVTQADFGFRTEDEDPQKLDLNVPRLFNPGVTRPDYKTSPFESVFCDSTACQVAQFMPSLDEDGDTILNDWDRCPGSDDLADANQDGVPCHLDAVDQQEHVCGFGLYEDSDFGCVQDSCSIRGVSCDTPKNCQDLHVLYPELPTGQYLIAPTGMMPVFAMCDMDTDGGGWTLVLNYAHDPTQRLEPVLKSGDLPLYSNVPQAPGERQLSWGHAAPGVVSALEPREARFHAHRENPLSPLTLHFKTNLNSCLSYLSTGLGSCQGIQDTHDLLEGHSSAARLPGQARDFSADQGEYAMTHLPFYISGVGNPHWHIAGGNQFWVDDHYLPEEGGTPHRTVHRVWVR